MIFSRKNRLFWVNLPLTGTLIFGAPVSVSAEKTPDPSEIQGPVMKSQEEHKALQEKRDVDSISGKADENKKHQERDYSEEGQISKPSYSYKNGPGTEGFVDDSTDNTYGYYTIMGTTTVTLEEMTSLYEENGAEYPASLKEGGAETIEDFCSIILEEAELEGVRGEVVYVQAMLETGWLQFGEDAVESQYNFSGLGTTGGGVQGNSYPDVRTGIRAQVQHLKAYASTEELNDNCVDSRFDMVTRGSAPYVEWLGIQENPNGGGWADGAGYGEMLIELLEDMKEK